MKLKNNKVYKIKVIECGCEHIGLVVEDGEQTIIIPDLETEFKTSENGKLFEVVSRLSSKELFGEMVKEDDLNQVVNLLSSKKIKHLKEDNFKLAKEAQEKSVIIRYLEGNA